MYMLTSTAELLKLRIPLIYIVFYVAWFTFHLNAVTFFLLVKNICLSLQIFVFETIHTIGIAILVFVALPELDVIKGVLLTNCLGLIPGILLLISRMNISEEHQAAKRLHIVFDCVAIVFQLSAMVIWPITESDKLTHVNWAIPCGLFCISFGWWENFICKLRPTFSKRSCKTILENAMNYLYNVEAAVNVKRARYAIYSVLSLWKALTFFVSMTMLVCFVTSDETGKNRFFIFKYFLSAKDNRDITVTTTNTNQIVYQVADLDSSSSYMSSSWYLSSAPETTTVEADPMAAIYSFVILVRNLTSGHIQHIQTWVDSLKANLDEEIGSELVFVPVNKVLSWDSWSTSVVVWGRNISCASHRAFSSWQTDKYHNLSLFKCKARLWNLMMDQVHKCVTP